MLIFCQALLTPSAGIYGFYPSIIGSRLRVFDAYVVLVVTMSILHNALSYIPLGMPRPRCPRSIGRLLQGERPSFIISLTAFYLIFIKGVR